MEISALAAIIVAILTFVWWCFRWFPHKRLPPGPTAWPLIGCIPALRTLGNPLLATSSLEAKFGKVVTFWIGPRPLIIVNDPGAAHEALIQKDALFASRARLRSAKKFTSGFKAISLSDNGPYWRMLRRNLQLHLLSSSRLETLKLVRQAEVQLLMQKLKSEAAENAGIVSLYPPLRRTIFDMVFHMCFGSRLDQKKIREVDDLLVARLLFIQQVKLADYVPFMRLFSGKDDKYVQGLVDRTNEVLLPIIVEFRELKKAGQIVPGRYVETLLELETEGDPKSKITDEAILSLCCELMSAATSTTAEIIEAAMGNLMNLPDAQAKLVGELDNVVGRTQLLDESDLDKLPYLQAVVKETLRRHPPARVTLPHSVSEPSKLAGYDVPTNAVILFHIQAFHHDPNLWTDPTVFKPERFLEPNMEKADITGVTEVKFVPFGAGRRICPGMNLAMLELPLVIGRMVQCFEWSAPDGRKLDLDTQHGVESSHFVARIRERGIDLHCTVDLP